MLRCLLPLLAVALVAASDGRATPLQDAALAGDARLVRLLLDAGADAAAADLSGMTALHYAAALGKAEVVKALLTAGANPNVRDARGVTPLHLATGGGHTEAAALLLAGGADANPGFAVDGAALRAAEEQVFVHVEVTANGDRRDKAPSSAVIVRPFRSPAIAPVPPVRGLLQRASPPEQAVRSPVPQAQSPQPSPQSSR